MAKNIVQEPKVRYADEVDKAIEGILRDYSEINANDILLFAPIQYPIADIEIDFEEKSFEEFETVQFAVLRFLALKHKSAAVIASLMGLTQNYVQKIIDMFCSWGYLDNEFNLTLLGSQCLQHGKKITTVQVAQRFQLDAVSLELIRPDEIVSNSQFVENLDDIPSIDSVDNVSKEFVVSQLQNDQFRSILANKNKALNVNISKVNSVTCFGVKYIRAYVLQLKNELPLVFAERENFSKIGRQKYSWLPLAISVEETVGFLKSSDASVYTSDVFQKISNIIGEIKSQSEDDVTRNHVANVVTGIVSNKKYGFVLDYINCESKNGIIEIKSKDAFSKIDFDTILFLKKMFDNKVVLFTNKNLRGVLIKAYSTDKEILSAINKLDKILLSQEGNDDVYNIRLFAKKVEKFADKNIIDIINEYPL